MSHSFCPWCAEKHHGAGWGDLETKPVSCPPTVHKAQKCNCCGKSTRKETGRVRAEHGNLGKEQPSWGMPPSSSKGGGVPLNFKVWAYRQLCSISCAKPQWKRRFKKVFESESHSVTSYSLQLHGLYRPWNSPGQNTGVVAFLFSKVSSQPRDRTQVSCTAGGFFTS